MFEAAELGSALSKEQYLSRVPRLRAGLLAAQQELRSADFPVVVLFAGVDGAGKSETVNLLNEWMDPRWVTTRAFGEPSDEERERPEFWRFWRELPPRGRIGLLLSTWYSRPILSRVYRRTGTPEFDEQLSRIAQFEEMLAADGALILKFWMHLGKAAQKQRLRRLEKDKLTRWRVTKVQWKHWGMYGRFIAASEQAISRTSTPAAPWTIVEGFDERYRSITVATLLRDALRRRLDERAAAKTPVAVPSLGKGRRAANPDSTLVSRSILASLDMSQKVAKDDFKKQLEKYQGRLNLLQRKAAARGVSTILVFEGWDAAGKGGAIRRVTGALDARSYQVIPIAAPTDEERAHHYLWRFWRHLSRGGRVTIFDRSWYGRVLVERVEGFATAAEWGRAYSEIDQFEDQLVDHGIVVLKFWLHISSEEQLRRFKARARTAYKRWKITDEDWRNREKWDAYERAVDEMVERTSTRRSPWTLVEANDKNFARLKVLRTICDGLSKAVD